MLKRGTWWLLIGAIALGGGVLLLESNQLESNREMPSSEAVADVQNTPNTLNNRGGDGSDSEGELIFPFSEGEVNRIVLNRPDDRLAFARATNGTWQMTEPEAGQAESGAIAFLLSQLTNPTTRTLSVEPSALEDFGLTNPETTLVLTANETDYQLAVGTPDFTGDNLYVQLTATELSDSSDASSDEASGTTKIHLVSGGPQKRD